MTNISEECFQHLVESTPRRIKAVLKAKWVQPGTSTVYLIKWAVSVCRGKVEIFLLDKNMLKICSSSSDANKENRFTSALVFVCVSVELLLCVFAC